MGWLVFADRISYFLDHESTSADVQEMESCSSKTVSNNNLSSLQKNNAIVEPVGGKSNKKIV